jgi:hypothetical protein
MTWTHEKPTVPGWYWYHMPSLHTEPSMVYFDAINVRVWFPRQDRYYSFDDLPGEFAGPIPEPKGE